MDRLLTETLKESAGFLTNSERGNEFSDSQINQVYSLLANGEYNGQHLSPYRREFLIKEALTTSDFPLLFGDVLDRQLLAAYKAVAPTWKTYMRLSTVRDFKTAYRYAVTGGDQFLAQVSEKGEYLASERDEARYSIAALKYGRQFDISWEAIINDDLDALKDTPTRFAMAAARTEHRLAVGQYAQDSGGGVAHATSGQLYSTLAGEVNETTALLTIANLENGVEAMASFLDANGEPIMNRARYLVVPPALEMTARQILTSSQKVWSDNAAGPVAYPTNNVISQYGLTLIVDPYLPIMDVVNGGGGTTANQGWYLFADPRDIAAVEVAHLRGHERPEICMKASDKVTIGGGAINSMSGDFATDNILYRVRLVVGVTTLDWRATYFGGHTD